MFRGDAVSHPRRIVFARRGVPGRAVTAPGRRATRETGSAAPRRVIGIGRLRLKGPTMATESYAIGPVTYLSVGATAATVEVDGIDGREKCQLWTDSDWSVPDRVTQSMWVSMCREALAHGSEVLVALESANSAQVVSIRLGRPPQG